MKQQISSVVRRPGWMGQVIYLEFYKRIGFDSTVQWYIPTLEVFLENKKWNSMGVWNSNMKSKSGRKENPFHCQWKWNSTQQS